MLPTTNILFRDALNTLHVEFISLTSLTDRAKGQRCKFNLICLYTVSIESK